MARKRGKGGARKDGGAPAGAPARSRRGLALAAGALLLLPLLAWGGLRLLGRGERGERAAAPGALAPFPAPTFAATAEVAREDFAGSDACASCHRAQHEAWARSTHGRAGGQPGPDLLIAPFDGTPIRFRDGTVLPRVREGRYEFLVRQEGQPEVTYSVDGVVGGGHMRGGGTQGFLSRMGDGTVRFLPFDWSRQGARWFCNTGTRKGEGWLPITPAMALADCGDWPPVRVLGDDPRFANCQGCHGSQIGAGLVPGEGYRTDYTSLSVNCESCHGPARRHVEMARSGGFADADLGLPSLAGADKDASLEVCFRCHALKDVLREGWLPGEPLETHYALKFPVLGDEPYNADGRVRTFAYQATHLFSACYLEGPMDCVSCHEPHGQGYWDVNRRPLPDPLDDGQCTACHASKAADPRAHTFHDPGSQGSRCVSCHMPYLQHPEVGPGVRFARSDHTIPVPRPGFDARSGVTDACALCHRDLPAAELGARAAAWWGELKPHRPLVGALLEVGPGVPEPEAAERLLRPDQHDPMPQFQALARFLLDRLESDGAALDAETEERLRALARSGDLDVRALALAALHWASGDDPGTRDFLVRELRSAGSAEEALRRRWALALGFLGDTWRDRGDVAKSRAGYRKALEVLPDDPRVLASLGVAYNRLGDFASAASAFRGSLERDPSRPLTWVNLGIALGGMGDAAGAAEAYRRALELNPWEPLAHFNLGNAHLRAERLEEALASYRRALEADPGLGRAHFYAGRVLGQLGRYQEALPHARKAVELEPGHAPADEMLRTLEQLTATPAR